MKKFFKIIVVVTMFLSISNSTYADDSINQEEFPKNGSVSIEVDLSDPESYKDLVSQYLATDGVNEVIVIDPSLIVSHEDVQTPDNPKTSIFASASYYAQNRRYRGLYTGVETLAIAMGYPDVTLTINTPITVSNSFNIEGINGNYKVSDINRTIGFNIRKSNTLSIVGTWTVPSKDPYGIRVRQGYFKARPVYDYYEFDCYMRNPNGSVTKMGSGKAANVVGYTFTADYSYL